MSSAHTIIFNHYSGGFSGHFNVTFVGGGLQDFTVGLNIPNNIFGGFDLFGEGADGRIWNEDARLDDLTNPPTHRKSVEVDSDTFHSIRSRYKALTLENNGEGAVVDWDAFPHISDGHNCTVLAADVYRATGLPGEIGDLFSVQELQTSFAGAQILNKFTTFLYTGDPAIDLWTRDLVLDLHVRGVPVTKEILDSARYRLESSGQNQEIVREKFLEEMEEKYRGKYTREHCFVAGTLVETADGTLKPIERIALGDGVLAFDPAACSGRGALVPRRVTQLFATPERVVLDFHGLRVTPGHVFLCGDGPQAGRFRMLMDILCDDGAIVDRDGRCVRAATNCFVGTPEDAFVEIAFVTEPDSQAWQGTRLRAGTRLCLPDGESTTVLECLQGEGYRLRSDGLVERDGEAPHPLPWFGVPPRPEDYVLTRSGLALADLYAEAGQRPTPVWPTPALSQYQIVDRGAAVSKEQDQGAGGVLHLAKRAGETLQ